METTNEIKKAVTTDLYHLSNDFQTIQQELIENGGELTCELMEKMDAIEMTQETAVESIFKVMRQMDLFSSAIKEEKKRLDELQRARTKSVESLKNYLFRWMDMRGIEKVETPLVTAKITAGRNKVVCVEEDELKPYMSAVDDIQSKLPPFIKVELSISKKELGEWIKEGKPVINSAIIREPSLQIK